MRNANPPIMKKGVAILIAIGLVFVIGMVDILTGIELGFSIFFLIPISIVTQRVGISAGYFIAIISTLAWILADIAARGFLYQISLSFYGMPS